MDLRGMNVQEGVSRRDLISVLAREKCTPDDQSRSNMAVIIAQLKLFSSCQSDKANHLNRFMRATSNATLRQTVGFLCTVSIRVKVTRAAITRHQTRMVAGKTYPPSQ